MNDKELDDFFRNKAENPDIPYHPEDWDKMKALLDRPSPPGGNNGSGRGNRGWLWGILALMIISGAGLGWKYFTDGESQVYKNDSPESQVERRVSGTNPLETAAGDSAQSPDPVGRSLAAGLSDLSPQGAMPESERPVAQAPESQREKGVQEQDQPSGFQLTVSRKKADIVVRALDARMKGFENLLTNQQLSTGLFPSSEVLFINNSPEEEKKTAQLPANNSREEKKAWKEQRFSMALSFAPDVSAPKIRDISGLGSSVGLNVEYFIHPDFSINAGALYAFKTYGAGEGNYSGYVPAATSIDGQCWVLDLPLNVRYYAINQKLGRWYVSAGLSSYLMLREKYDLQYKYYGKKYEKQLDIRNNNRHYFDIVNLGLGYERVLTDKLALQVEPYLKLPVKGIGEGSIDLKSAGVLIGLKYNW